MQQQLEQFDAQVYQHPEFSDRNNLTGDPHSHRNAQLSAVFYVLTDPANESGALEFEESVDTSAM